jgi:hypothetical protein
VFAKALQREQGVTEVVEQPMQKFQSRMGDARWSAYTGQGGFFSGKVRGYRATIMGTERAIYLNCLAPARDWPMVEKAFQRVIGSVCPGGA